MIDDILKNKQSPQKIQTPEQQPKPVQQVTRQAPAAPQSRRRRDGERDRGRAPEDPAVLEHHRRRHVTKR